MSAEQDLANANVQIANLISEVTRFRDAAMGLNAIYPTITEGRQTVADGQYFSVPGSGAYMRLYRRQGSSAELIAEFPDRDELLALQSQISELLSRGVVARNVNSALLAEGGYGVGTGAITHENTSFGEAFSGIAPNQFFSFENSDFSEIGLDDLSYGGLLVNRSVRPLALLFPNSQRLFMTYRGPGGWFPAIEFITTGNMVGTVSQSGGVPTGAVIERGSNTNGEYIKFADGTLICPIRGNFPDGTFSPLGALFATPPITVDFPAAFISHPVVSLGSSFGASGIWAGLGNSGTSTTGTSIRAYRTSAVTGSIRYEAIAIGRWY